MRWCVLSPPLDLLQSRPVADWGLRTTSVPSARAGQQTDPAARRDALAGLLTGGFLVAVIAVALLIVLTVPQYAEPALAGETGDDSAAASADPSADPEASSVPLQVQPEPTSKSPDKLRGYRWPVRGGEIAAYYGPDKAGDFLVEGVRVNDGMVITWFPGAVVKAAHKGTVVAAGRDWAESAGFDGTLDRLYKRYASITDAKAAKKSDKPPFPVGIVIDDGNGYYSIYTELKDVLVEQGAKVKAGQPIGHMSAHKTYMVRYRLVRMDGPLMKTSESARLRGYPDYARERVDPLVVLSTTANNMPLMRRKPPVDPPHLSDY
jgi:murein DD-endopeptidase MepM/ murein hydrolase activator NlpD